MSRTKGSKNKATLAREVQDQVDIQDRHHLNTQNEQVLAVIDTIWQYFVFTFSHPKIEQQSLIVLIVL